jgi:hypothetical protein
MNDKLKEYYNESAMLKLKEMVGKKYKTRVISVSCFSMGGNYVCPYYRKEYTEEAKEHCAKCWNS